MSTAQVSIELVLAGILALCAFVLPFFTGVDIGKNLFEDNIWIAVLGLAYLIGVVFDKLADTILSPFEHIQRLRLADEYLAANPAVKEQDAFPQSAMEAHLRKENDGRLEWMESLKSRVRTSRELAILGLPATTGAVIYLGFTTRWEYAFVGVNLLLFMAAIGIDLRRPDKKPNAGEKKVRTDNLEKDMAKRTSQLKLAEKQMHTNAIVYYLILANSLAAIITLAMRNPFILLYGVGGVGITLLSFWTTMRITRTYLRFVAESRGEYTAQNTK